MDVDERNFNFSNISKETSFSKNITENIAKIRKKNQFCVRKYFTHNSPVNIHIIFPVNCMATRVNLRVNKRRKGKREKVGRVEKKSVDCDDC